MADNVTLNDMSGGDVIAADDIAGVKYQRMKVAWGADGTANEATSASPLPVTVGVNNVNVVIVAPSSVGAAAASVPTAGTAVRLPNQTTVAVTLRASPTNVGTIYVGGLGVTSANGFPLAAGEAINLDVVNTNSIYINASVSGETVRYLWVQT